ncbi:MAG TPA: hypothetical protein VGK67_11665 [Myxococcales bacterium]|jgi:hypothetical protein
MRKPTFARLPLLLVLAGAGCSGPAAAPSEPRSAGASLASDEAADAVAAANSGLRLFLDRIPEGQRAGYGFASREEIDRAQLGAPYRVWTADPARVESGAQGESLRATREWRFPVTVDGQYRALLTVGSIHGGALQAVDLGAAGLAQELGQHEKERRIPAQAERVLLRLYQLRADLVAFPAPASKLEDAAFEALASARALPKAPQGAVGLPHLLPWLRERFAAVRPR